MNHHNEKKVKDSSQDANNSREPIAVIGIGCRFPGGITNPENFWQLLTNGVDAISEIPEDRWSIEKFYSKTSSKPGKTVSKWGGFVDQRIEHFDAHFFGMSPREASYLDPMQRWLMEVSWEAFEDAGLVPEKLAGSDTAVYIGGFTEDIKLLQMDPSNRDLIGAHAATGSAMTMLANRLSYIYDFHGPSVALDTACSSSLVSVHLACQSILNGESSLALAGGVNAMFRPDYTIAESKAGMLSADGRSKAFDHRANGYVRGEGAGIVVLKRLKDALNDGNQIYAVIRSSGVNQDGRTNGITVPNGKAQQKLLQKVCKEAGLKPAQIKYVEAHGTGTPVGDPIEINALAEVLKKDRDTNERCWVGSVKTNMGHLEAAAGIAGLIKTVLVLNNKTVPPHLHMQKPNPAIDFQKLCLSVALKNESLSTSDTPIYACVNSFGFGGTNANIILENAPAKVDKSIQKKSTCDLLTLSARSEEALLSVVQAYRKQISDHNDSDDDFLHNLCYSAALHRTHHNFRLAIPVNSREKLIENLDLIANGELVENMAKGRISKDSSKVVFVFSGMGPQWWAMGQQLLQQEPLFLETVKKCDKLLSKIAPWSLLQQMQADEEHSRISETQIAQPASFALQVGLAELLRSWGITPDAIIGHSAGEVAAAYCAGVYSLEDAITIIYHRSRLQHKTTGQGKLLAVGLSLNDAKTALKGFEDNISIAAVNSPHAVTIVGEREILDKFIESIKNQNVFTKYLKVDVPYHSHYMEPIKDELYECLKNIKPQPAQVALYSTVSAKRSDGVELDADYWWKNVRNSVLFAPATNSIISDGYDTFVEIGAHPVLTSSIQECYDEKGKSAKVFCTLRRKTDEKLTMLNVLGNLYTEGFSIDWHKIYPDGGQYIKLPHYPWQREYFWSESEKSKAERVGTDTHPLLGNRLSTAHPVWENNIDIEILPFIKDHVVRGNVVYPGAAYIEMMLTAAKDLFNNGDSRIELNNIKFKKALFLSDEIGSKLQVNFASKDAHLTISGLSSEQNWNVHCTANIKTISDFSSQNIDIEKLKTECINEIPLQKCYNYLRNLGLEYGPLFQGINRVWTDGSTSTAYVKVDESISTQQYILHPVLLDACFQVMLTTSVTENDDVNKQRVYLPTSIESIKIYRNVPDKMWVRTFMSEINEKRMRGDFEAYDDNGNVILEVTNVVANSLDHVETKQMCDVSNLFYDFKWELISKERKNVTKSDQAGYWIIFADNRGFGQILSQRLIDLGDRPVLVFQGTKYEVNSDCSLTTIEPENFEHMNNLISAVTSKQHDQCKGIIHLWSLDWNGKDEITTDVLQKANGNGPVALLHLIKVLDKTNVQGLPKIWAVTEGAQAVTPESMPVNFFQNPIWAIMRVIGYQEHTDRFGGIIDLDFNNRSVNIDMLLEDILTEEKLDHYAYRNGERYTAKFVNDQTFFNNSLPIVFRPDCSYLITGGLGGLGLVIAKWMVKCGARRLILIGRSSIPERKNWASIDQESSLGKRIKSIQELESMGASVHLGSFDIAEEEHLVAFLDQYHKEGWPPIRGCIHAAGVSKPNLMINMTKDEFIETLRPKVIGAWLLHKHLGKEPLECFVLFSSVAAFAFTAGQADYACANAFLDGLAQYRRAKGLPAVSINWGPWGEAGMATLLGDYFEKRGMIPFDPNVGLQALGTILKQNVKQKTVLWISGPEEFVNNNFSSGSNISFLSHIVESGRNEKDKVVDKNSDADPLQLIISAEDSDKALEIVTEYIKKSTAKVLRTSLSKIDCDCPLNEQGLDSLLAVEIRNLIGRELKVSLSVIDLLKGASIHNLAAQVYKNIADNNAKERKETAEDVPVSGYLPLAPNQKWFLARNLPNPHHWNMAALWDCIRPLNIEYLERALQAVLTHHDLLRARFSFDGSNWTQRIEETTDKIPLTIKDLSMYKKDEQDEITESTIAEFQNKLNLFDGPMIQVVYFDFGKTQSHKLLLIIHHLISDIFSQQIVIADIQNAYNQFQKNKQVKLPAKTASFKQFVDHLTEYTNSKNGMQDSTYWLSHKWDKVDTLPIDIKDGRKHNTIASSRVLIGALNEGETALLLHEVPKMLHTQTLDVLLAALGLSFGNYAKLNSLLLDIIMHGRKTPSAHLDLARTVGLFAHGVPYQLEINNDCSKIDYLLQIKKHNDLFMKFEHTYSPLRWLCNDDNVRNSLQNIPKRELIFNYIGQFEPPTSEDDLFKVVPKVPRDLEDPKNFRDFILQCQIGVLSGKLTTIWNYSEYVHNHNTIMMLNDNFLSSLRYYIKILSDSTEKGKLEVTSLASV